MEIHEESVRKKPRIRITITYAAKEAPSLSKSIRLDGVKTTDVDRIYNIVKDAVKEWLKGEKWST
jgi:hypothetical protein